VRVRANKYRKGQWVCYFNPRKFVGRQDKRERKYTGPFLTVGTPSPVTVQLQRRKGAPYERWYIDLTGPHPRSQRGHVYILTCVEYEYPSTNIGYEVDSTQPLERPRREVRAPKYVRTNMYVQLLLKSSKVIRI